MEEAATSKRPQSDGGPTSPDGRLWTVRGITDAESASAGDKLPPVARPNPRRLFLTAASLPDAVSDPLEAARKGLLWHPGVSVP
jgi:hypothetical protein